MTKTERKHIYYAAIFEIVAFGLYGKGICHALEVVLHYRNMPPFMHLSIEFPELSVQNPDCPSWKYWFPEGAYETERLECLSKAIDICENRTK